MPRRTLAAVCFSQVLSVCPLFGTEIEVRLTLPLPAQVDLSGRDTLLVLPFAVLSGEEERRLDGDLDLQEELARYLERVLRRETDLRLVEAGPIDYPTYDLELLSRDHDFWRALGERTQADLLLAGTIDLDLQDRSGYRSEPYASPLDGSTLYRQVLVEQTGFELDLLVKVFDGRSGRLLHADNFKDFRSLENGSGDPLRGLFANLHALESRLLGLFARRTVVASRSLLLD